MKNYLTEAFKKLDVLDEDVFELDDDGIAQLKDFEIKSEEDDTVSIIDPEAEDEADLSDNYLGKVILDCCVCHSKIYKDADDVHLDEDGELANVDEECPFCYSTDGYKVIGQVTEFNPASEEEVEVKAEEDGDEEEVNVEVKDKEEVEESVKCKKGRCAEKCDEKVSTRDDIDAEADDKKERAKKAFARAKDDADSDRDYRLKKHITKKTEALRNLKNESLDSISIDTGDQIIDVSAQDKEEPVEELSDEETIAPVSDEVKAEIEAGSEIPEGEDEVEVDEFSEEDFDGLGESYLKKAYNNVDSYKTTKASIDGNFLKLEGVIKFKSGNSKKTNFIFESKTIDKSGRCKFIGENAQICKGRKAFTVIGKIDSGKFLPESLNYNYKVKDNNTGVSKRVYGTVRTPKH